MRSHQHTLSIGLSIGLSTGLSVALLAGLAPAAAAKPGYLPRVTSSQLTGTWRETKRGANYRGYTPSHSYYIFKRRGGRLTLKASAGAMLWSNKTSGGRTTHYKSLHHAQDYAVCTVARGILTCRTGRSCGKLHALERRKCLRMSRTDRYTVQIWRNDVADFDLLVLNGTQPVQQQKWFFRVPVKPPRRTAESRLITNWWTKSYSQAFSTSTLRFFWLKTKGFRYRTVVDTKDAAGRYTGVTLTVGSYRVRRGQIHFTQDHAFFCPGIYQAAPSTEAVAPADLVVCRGGPRSARFAWPYRLARAGGAAGSLHHLDVTVNGRPLRMSGIPE